MPKFILMMLLAVVCNNAVAATAEWVKVDSSKIHTVYLEPSTIRKDGNRVKMWDLKDYKTAQVIKDIKPYMSMKTQQEYDCSKEKTRILYTSFHSENMGEGAVVYSYDDTDKWLPASPGSVREFLWKIACGKL